MEAVTDGAAVGQVQRGSSESAASTWSRTSATSSSRAYTSAIRAEFRAASIPRLSPGILPSDRARAAVRGARRWPCHLGQQALQVLHLAEHFADLGPGDGGAQHFFDGFQAGFDLRRSSDGRSILRRSRRAPMPVAV